MILEVYNYFKELLNEQSTIRNHIFGVQTLLYEMRGTLESITSVLVGIRDKPYPIIVTIKGVSSYKGVQEYFTQTEIGWVAKGLMKQIVLFPQKVVKIDEVSCIGGLIDKVIIAGEILDIQGIGGRLKEKGVVDLGNAVRVHVYLPETTETTALFMREN